MLKSEKYQDLTQNVEKSILVEELKLSCTNVMLQCLDSESRSIFLFGTMFKVDRRIAGEILEITPEVSRQRRSRIQVKMADIFWERIVENPAASCFSCRGYFYF